MNTVNVFYKVTHQNFLTLLPKYFELWNYKKNVTLWESLHISVDFNNMLNYVQYTVLILFNIFMPGKHYRFYISQKIPTYEQGFAPTEFKLHEYPKISFRFGAYIIQYVLLVFSVRSVITEVNSDDLGGWLLINQTLDL